MRDTGSGPERTATASTESRENAVPVPDSLRDYFAGQALAGITVNPNAEALVDTMGDHGYADIPEALAAIAYGIADRMLAERERDS